MKRATDMAAGESYPLREGGHGGHLACRTRLGFFAAFFTTLDGLLNTGGFRRLAIHFPNKWRSLTRLVIFVSSLAFLFGL